MEVARNENKVVVSIPTGIFKNRYGVTASFSVGVLLFFLPFLTIKCNDVKLASATGIQIAKGFELEPGREWKNLGRGIFDREAEKNTSDNDRDQSDGDEKNSMKRPGDVRETNKSLQVFGPNYLMIAVFAAGLLGIIFSLLRLKKNWLICLIAGWVGIIGFIISVFAILEKTKEYQVDAGFLKLSVNFTFWFFVSVIAYVTAVVLSHRQWTEAQALAREKEISEFILASGFPTGENVSSE